MPSLCFVRAVFAFANVRPDCFDFLGFYCEELKQRFKRWHDKMVYRVGMNVGTWERKRITRAGTDWTTILNQSSKGKLVP